MEPITLDGKSLTRTQVVSVASGKSSVALDDVQLQQVRRTADFIAAKVQSGAPIYGVTTGFGNNADKFLGKRRARSGSSEDTLASCQPLTSELQENLILTHAVCVGEPMSADVVRAMLVIRINTLMNGHSGIRAETLASLARLLNSGIVPVVPSIGSVGASGDLAPLSHLAIVLMGHGEAFLNGVRLPGGEALRRAGLSPVRLSYKEGLALNNGTAQMLAMAVLALDRLEYLLGVADLAAAMSLNAFGGRGAAFREDVHRLRPHPGQVAAAAHIRELLSGSTLVDVPYYLVPRFETWTAGAWGTDEARQTTFDLSWRWVTTRDRLGREPFYAKFPPFKGGKKYQPQDAYCLRCTPQVHGAVRDAWMQACRVVDVELNSVTDNPLIFPENADADGVDKQIVSAGHFHGMPLSLVMSYVKAAIPVLASISERRLNKLVDPANNDGLPAFLAGNEDATDSGFMIVQYTAAALVNDLATRAHPASVYSIPTSANTEDHVSMGANEARHVLDMTNNLSDVLALELYVAAQALDYRLNMLTASHNLAKARGARGLEAKIENAPPAGTPDRNQFDAELRDLVDRLVGYAEFTPGPAVAAAHACVRASIKFLRRDRELQPDIVAICQLVRQRAFTV